MNIGFKIITETSIHKPNFIVVANYETENEVVNWQQQDFDRMKSRSDVGVWKIKYKSNTHAA